MDQYKLKARCLALPGAVEDLPFGDLRSSVYGHIHRSRPGAALPAKLLRMGVRYADGTKATTIGQHRRLGRQPRLQPGTRHPHLRLFGRGRHRRHARR